MCGSLIDIHYVQYKVHAVEVFEVDLIYILLWHAVMLYVLYIVRLD